MLTLTKYREIIDGKPIHIATVTPDGEPNLSIASDVYYDLFQRAFFSNSEVSPFGATKPKGTLVIEAVEAKEHI